MDTEAVLDRIKQAKSLKNDREIAALLGLSPQDFSNRKKRGTLRPLLVEWAAKERLNVSWILTGEGEMYEEGRVAESASGTLDPDLLRLVIEAIEQGLEELDLELKPVKKADLIVTVYEMYRQGKEVDRVTLIRLIRLAA